MKHKTAPPLKVKEVTMGFLPVSQRHTSANWVFEYHWARFSSSAVGHRIIILEVIMESQGRAD